MKVYKHPVRDKWNEFLERPTPKMAAIEKTVSSIMAEVKKKGDSAVLQFTEKYDKVKLTKMQVSEEEIAASEGLVSEELKSAIKVAYQNILTFHAAQRENYRVVETMPGVKCWRRAVAIESVGLYIPGGSAPLFSTVLMLGVPAKLVGCQEIVVCVPPRADGTIHPAILYAAKLVGLKTIFKVGGVQAIASMTYGTATVPKVYKIFGPGNLYVTTAKKMAYQEGVTIDMPAGPSELMIVADSTMPASFVASDLLSQAEHGEDSQVLLVTFEEAYLKQVQAEIEKQMKALPRKDIIKESLKNSSAIIVKTQKDATDIVNAYAPEHLIIGLRNCNAFAMNVQNAGSIFLGNYSPESVGDYASGTNHTLPTGGFAKMFSGIMIESFAKKISYQQLTPEGFKNIANTVSVMAEAEELLAHKHAIEVRLAELEGK